MADKEKEEPQENAASGKKTILIFGFISLILMIGVGIGAYLLGSRMSAAPAPEAETTMTENAGAENGKSADTIGPMIPIDDFIVNLLDRDEVHYLKASMTIEVDSEKTAEEVNLRMSQIRDTILLLTSSKTQDELRDLQGKLQLRTELLENINEKVQTGKVTNIYFTNFVIQ